MKLRTHLFALTMIGNLTVAAKLLGTTRNRLYRVLRAKVDQKRKEEG